MALLTAWRPQQPVSTVYKLIKTLWTGLLWLKMNEIAWGHRLQLQGSLSWGITWSTVIGSFLSQPWIGPQVA